MPPIIVGHRGVAATHPENTAASIKQAARLGLKWVEVDIQITLDNQLVVCHDHTLNRCSNGQGRIDQHTLAELRQFDFGSWKSEHFRGETLLTLSELLTLTEQYHLNVNLEIKVDTRHQAAHVVELVKATLVTRQVDPERVLLSSFSHAVTLELAKHLPQYRRGVITDNLTPEDVAQLTAIQAFSCHVNYQTLTQTQLDKLKQQGIQVWCFTVNDAQAFTLFDQVNAIFTDEPQMLFSKARQAS